MAAAASRVDGPGPAVYRLPLTASNAYLLETPEALVLVDAGMPRDAEAILARLTEFDKPLCLIYITHAHIDHFGAAAEVRRQTGAEVVVHQADAAALAAGETHLGTIRNWRWTQSPLPFVERLIQVEPTSPDREVVDGETITVCGLAATVLHTPGHTPGSSTLLVEGQGGRYAFPGDLFSTTGGLHVQRSYAHDWAQVAASVAVLAAQQPEMVFPGHGSTMISAAALAALELDGPAAAVTPRP
jgi:glyoxylase-like metal-dependent hydrolase (beta-lactamase superfamily II)